MTQPQPLESTNNHRPQPESPSFVKRGKLWIPETAERRSLPQKFWNWTGFKEKKLWDVLQLLIVPSVLAIGAFYLQETAKQRDLQIAEANRQKDQKIADDRAKQETLNRYFDQISTLLFDKGLRTAKEGSEARIVARARTVSVLRELDEQRNRQLLDFLIEAELTEEREPIISLRSSDLAKANLRKAYLARMDLQLVKLDEADLREANLTGANLFATDLINTDLREADLTEANLAWANLQGANLHKADLRGAKLDSYLLQDAYLCNTTMPDGTKSDRDCDKLKSTK